MNNATQALDQFRALIADDSHALTFQSFGQYRSALLKEIDARRASTQPKMSPEMKAAIEEAHKTGATAALLPNGAAVFINYGHDYGDSAHLECTACGGSGHIEDQQAITGRRATQPIAAAGSELHIGVANNDQGVHVNIIQRHADGSCTVIYSAKAPVGDSYGRAATVVEGATGQDGGA